MNKLVYKGALAVTFRDYHRVIEPGDEFTVGDGVLANYLARPDVDWAPEPTPEPVEPEPVKQTKKTAQ